MNPSSDRLFDLLPAVHRQRDAEKGFPLRALLRVIAEQVEVVEDDIGRLYENWFIETCQDWAVPYIGDLLAHRIVHEAGQPGEVTTPQGLRRNKILIPRREVARTIHNRRRKGTLALLETLARDVAGWPARAVEFYRLLAWTQALNHQRLQRGRYPDLRDGQALGWVGGPFDEIAHSVDVRRIDAAFQRTRGRHNIPSLGLFVWRLKEYSVTRTPAYCQEEMGPHCYTFSVLGNDAPLYTKPRRETSPTDIAGPLDLPIPISRRALEREPAAYYGPSKSFAIWTDGWDGHQGQRLVESGEMMVADLSRWQYRPPRGRVAVDPVLGRIAFHPRQLPKNGVRVSYHYGFSKDMGGGEYLRVLSQPNAATLYRVGSGEPFKKINDALQQWQKDAPQHAVIEIADSGVYVEPINITFEQPRQSLQVRAANRRRPVLRLLNWMTESPDALFVSSRDGGRLTLDGLLIAGRGVQAEGRLDQIRIRHCTLVPGWSLQPDCSPRRPAEPSLELIDTQARVCIEESILGSIQVSQDEVGTDPLYIHISDSILDATGFELEALGAPTWPLAHARLSVLRSTVLGQIQTHSIDVAEDSIFMGLIKVARSQRGCMRFCYVTPGSRTPRRYHCQPDLVEEAARKAVNELGLSGAARDQALAAALSREAQRVRPRFSSVRYGAPGYGRLADSCAQEIRRGAQDESEMGALHDLFEPQRDANLRVRLDEYTPAGSNAGVIYAS